MRGLAARALNGRLRFPSGDKMVLTGPSGSGKSTLLQRLVNATAHLNIRGFLSPATESGQGTREAWHLRSVNGEAAGLLASPELPSSYRMGRMGVNLALFEEIAIPELQVDPRVDLYVIDEIGIISSWSQRFEAQFLKLMASPARVLIIARQRGDGLNRQLIEDESLGCLELCVENREIALAWLQDWALKARLNP